ncbi:hypothetical protein JHU38_04945 [Prevotella sp. A2931]|uniref:DUF6850 domain-containing protein n=1 Tax=Prevotella illustrans TaxID=2800387 RepID=A0ABS3M4N0_9BACT|nr:MULTISPECIES: DUF6850 family outer membrane beta-barrel protein [Prevotella]MBO1363128.1 hypothetical protein [Prevotella illustrans]PTL26150.1 hypothetical protein C3V39_03185 [Prevotella sp. oral taxon 820]
MMRNIRIYLTAFVLVACNQLYAQRLLDRVNHSLSPSEDRYHVTLSDFTLTDAKTVYANPAFTQWHKQNDTTLYKRSAIVYAGLAGADSKGDFIPYEGNAYTDYRIGAYGEYTTPRSGTLSGRIQYAQGKHRNIGWSAMRLPELYFPYISTDSCGGDFKFDSYFAEGNYAFTLNEWTLGAKASFYGEQAYRLTDPRALNNTTWLRFNTGVARRFGRSLLLLDVGYGRNKQHVQLRYWRPGQQDRFFVCYGFGLYDTRQSAVSFGKSRMYYIDEFNARLQYLSSQTRSLRLHASLGYSFDHMKTEESDIYNLYESRSHQLSPLIRLTFDPRNDWQFELGAMGAIILRKGYENIIEEYLIDKENNIYDFRTIDTRQNYIRNTGRFSAALKASRRIARLELSLQGGATTESYEEKYKVDGHRIRVSTITPHVKIGIDRQGTRDDIGLSILYARQRVVNNDYNVSFQNGQIARLDFQQAFAPYAFRCAELDKVVASVTWQHRMKKIDVGLNAKLYLADGNRKNDVSYTGTIGFPSTAPMIRATPDKHQEYWASLTTFVAF